MTPIHRFVALLTFVIALVACGSRTAVGIWVPPPTSDDAAADAPSDNVPDASDGGDASTDAAPDALPPPIDAARPPTLCDDASATVIYAVTVDGVLLQFDPITDEFIELVQADCQSLEYATAFSMAIDHKGNAYVEYLIGRTNGSELYQVSLLTGECTFLDLSGSIDEFGTFGMGFAVNDGGESETFYIIDSANGTLGTVDQTTLAVSVVGVTSPVVEEGELSGTGDGRLFTLYGAEENSAATIAQLNRSTVAATLVGTLPVDISGGWAFAFWGGDFYVFTGSPATVTEFNPDAGTSEQVAGYTTEIVGAASSTCAPVN